MGLEGRRRDVAASERPVRGARVGGRAPDQVNRIVPTSCAMTIATTSVPSANVGAPRQELRDPAQGRLSDTDLQARGRRAQPPDDTCRGARACRLSRHARPRHRPTRSHRALPRGGFQSARMPKGLPRSPARPTRTMQAQSTWSDGVTRTSSCCIPKKPRGARQCTVMLNRLRCRARGQRVLLCASSTRFLLPRHVMS